MKTAYASRPIAAAEPARHNDQEMIDTIMRRRMCSTSRSYVLSETAASKVSSNSPPDPDCPISPLNWSNPAEGVQRRQGACTLRDDACFLCLGDLVGPVLHSRTGSSRWPADKRSRAHSPSGGRQTGEPPLNRRQDFSYLITRCGRYVWPAIRMTTTSGWVFVDSPSVSKLPVEGGCSSAA